jgi:hypothetical protein
VVVWVLVLEFIKKNNKSKEKKVLKTLKIEDGILSECLDKEVTNIVIPEGVKKIGKEAFRDCKSLSSV